MFTLETNRFKCPLFLTLLNFNPNMDKYLYIHYRMWDVITYPFLNFNDCTVEV